MPDDKSTESVVISGADLSDALKPQLRQVTMWTHGHALSVESADHTLYGNLPNSLQLPNQTTARILCFGWGVEIYMGATNNDGIGREEQFWIHYAVPTPSLLNDRPVKAQQLIIRGLGSANPGVTLWGIHVYDGPKKILDNNQFVNAYPQGFVKNFMPQPFPKIEFGIGVSLLVGGDRATWDHKLTIHSVGMEFLT
jgi:hypothetical protein